MNLENPELKGTENILTKLIQVVFFFVKARYELVGCVSLHVFFSGEPRTRGTSPGNFDLM